MAYSAWQDENLKRKTVIAKHGAEGHLKTAREKNLANKMDTTMVRLDWMEATEGDEKVAPIEEPTDPEEIIQRTATDGATSDVDESTAPGDADP